MWRCDDCGAESLWGPTWSYYGSLLEADESPGTLPTFCSDACATEWAHRTGVKLVTEETP